MSAARLHQRRSQWNGAGGAEQGSTLELSTAWIHGESPWLGNNGVGTAAAGIERFEARCRTPAGAAVRLQMLLAPPDAAAINKFLQPFGNGARSAASGPVAVVVSLRSRHLRAPASHLAACEGQGRSQQMDQPDWRSLPARCAGLTSGRRTAEPATAC